MNGQAPDVPAVLLPWMEPVQQEIRRMAVAQRDVEFLRGLGFRCDRRNAPTGPEIADRARTLWFFTNASELVLAQKKEGR